MSTAILNVDDNAANRYVKSKILRAAGFEVLEGGTGAVALELAFERRPDLVLLDIRLPDISGLEVCRRLREDPRTQKIPVIHISATHVSPRDQAVSMRAGADIYLAEPVAAEELTSAVQALLRLRATEQGLAASEERLRLATEAAGIATWEIDAATGSAAWGPGFRAMLGAAESDAPTMEAWLARVHQDDRASLAAAFGAARMGRESLAHEHRIVLPRGGERWIAAFGRLHLDEKAAEGRMLGVAADITARKHAEAERETLLLRAREAQRVAEQAMRMKDEFLAMLSHELRTPMSAMLGWLHVLKTGRLDAEHQAGALDTIERNARVQAQLINDLLDVSRIVTGKMELDAENIQLDAALESAVESVRPAAADRDVVLNVSIEAGAWTMRGSAERVQQIFSNLISNAIKFSAKGARVDISLERRGHVAVASVQDHGEGIAPELLPHVFDRFRQADSSTRRRHGGLGLGLAIVRSLVELHGGKVQAASRGIGHGATFSVTLPLLFGREAAPRRPQPSRSEADLSGVRILVVDDDESNLQMIAQVLRLRGASVSTASDPGISVAVARSSRPELLVLDIGMPGKDGYELLPELRNALDADARTLPAIALSGLASSEDVRRALQAGFQAHVAKPCDMIALGHLVSQLARARGAAAQPSG